MLCANNWLNNVVEGTEENENKSSQNFSSFYSNSAAINLSGPDTNVLLPILTESVNSLSVVHHCMKLVRKITNHLNPSQVAILTADQPVYAIAKQIQWLYPERFKAMFIMLGPLHIEMAFMSAIGDWVNGSGWTDIFNKANFSTVGRIESFFGR